MDQISALRAAQGKYYYAFLWPSDAGRRHPAAGLTRPWGRGPAVAGL